VTGQRARARQNAESETLGLLVQHSTQARGPKALDSSEYVHLNLARAQLNRAALDNQPIGAIFVR
jgi:hypothetical protein